MDNLEKLKDQLYRKGFGSDHTQELEEKIFSGVPEFTIEHYTTMKNGDQMGYQLHFARSKKDDEIYFNSYTAGLLKNMDKPGEIREHTFPTKFMITAAEAYRMLKYGLDVAVNKNIYPKEKEGVKYNTWISLDLQGPKNEYGNYPEKTYHQNYYGGEPFLPTEALKKFKTPIKEVQYAMQLAGLDEKLRKANIVTVLYKDRDEERTGTIIIVPKKQGAILRDHAGNVVEMVSIPRKNLDETQKQVTVDEDHSSADQKKKPEKIEWKPRQKGMRP